MAPSLTRSDRKSSDAFAFASRQVADLFHINRWCREQVPEHLRDQARAEAELADRHVTIIETRPPWDGQCDWTRFAVARLPYVVKTGDWNLYWRDRNMKFHEYTRKRPTKNVQALLDYIGSHQDPIFWGESRTRHAVNALGVFQRNVNGGILWVDGFYLRAPPLDAVVDLMASADWSSCFLVAGDEESTVLTFRLI